MGTMEAVAISVAAGIWAGVVGWWFRASSVVRDCVEDARRSAPIDDASAATSVPPRRRTGWPAITGTTGATVAAAIVLGGRGPLWMTPFLVAWASGLVAMALIDEETLVLPSKLMYPYALVDLLLACHRGDREQQMAFPRERLDMRRSSTRIIRFMGISCNQIAWASGTPAWLFWSLWESAPFLRPGVPWPWRPLPRWPRAFRFSAGGTEEQTGVRR